MLATGSTRRAGARRGLLFVVTAAVLWGTVGVAGTLLSDRTGLSPLAVGFYRLAVAALATAALRAATAAGGGGGASGPRIARRDLPRVAAVGAGLAFYQVCYFGAVRSVGVSVATLVTLGLAPVLVAAGAAILFGERHGRAVLAALAAAVAGLALLVGRPAAPGAGEGAAAGIALAAGSAAGYAGVTLLSRTLAGRVRASRLTAVGFGVGAAVLAPLAVGAGLTVEPDAANLGLLLYLGVVPTALAYALFFAGLRWVRPTVASVVTLLEPLTATLLAAAAFGERLGPTGLAGGALLLGAVVALYAGQSGAEPVAAGPG